MSVLSDKTTEIILGISITGLVSTVVWLLKWCDQLGLECHDLRRDVAHLQRDHLGVSAAMVVDFERVASEKEGYSRYFTAIERRFNRMEHRLNLLSSRRSDDIKTDLD